MGSWEPTPTWRVVTSDGTLWCESSIKREVQDAFDKISAEAVTVHLPSGEKTYGPDPHARMEHLWEYHDYEWRSA